VRRGRPPPCRHFNRIYAHAVCALNCSGNPLDPGDLGTSHKEVTEKTLELAALLNVKKVIMMSGLPAASPDDKIPNWITYTVSWPPQLKDILDYQWEEVAIPYWRELVKMRWLGSRFRPTIGPAAFLKRKSVSGL
jgi:sugar phosphate isomerase/epimerase